MADIASLAIAATGAMFAYLAWRESKLSNKVEEPFTELARLGYGFRFDVKGNNSQQWKVVTTALVWPIWCRLSKREYVYDDAGNPSLSEPIEYKRMFHEADFWSFGNFSKGYFLVIISLRSDPTIRRWRLVRQFNID